MFLCFRLKNAPNEKKSAPNAGMCVSLVKVLPTYLRLTCPRTKLRRQIFVTQAEVWANNWAKFSGHFCASFAVQNDPPKFLLKLLWIWHSMSGLWRLKSQSFWKFHQPHTSEGACRGWRSGQHSASRSQRSDPRRSVKCADVQHGRRPRIKRPTPRSRRELEGWARGGEKVFAF